MKNGIFYLDGLEGDWPGQYEEGVFWNGWYCPRFAVEVCRKILEGLKEVEGDDFTYEVREHEIVIHREGADEPEVYAIDSGDFCYLGSGFWIWDKDE